MTICEAIKQRKSIIDRFNEELKNIDDKIILQYSEYNIGDFVKSKIEGEIRIRKINLVYKKDLVYFIYSGPLFTNGEELPFEEYVCHTVGLKDNYVFI